jgi:hypothetical protein
MQMKVETCSKCKASDGYIHRSGSVFSGGYGSAKYDTTQLAITDPDGLAGIDILCDGCTSELEEQGKLHAYMSVLCDVEDRRLPSAVYEVIFEHKALSVGKTIAMTKAGQILKGTTSSMEEVEDLRAELVYDPSNTTSFRTTQVMFAEETMRVAKTHVLAALVSGVDPDHDHIREAARRQAARREANVTMIEHMLEELSSDLN